MRIHSKKAQIFFIWLVIAALMVIVVFALIRPLKDGGLTPAFDAMGCSNPAPGYGSTCVVIKGALIWFVLGILWFVVKFIINKSQE